MKKNIWTSVALSCLSVTVWSQEPQFADVTQEIFHFDCDQYVSKVQTIVNDAKYLNQLKSECQIINDYRQIESRIFDKFRLPLKSIYEYQSMRFIRRVNYEDAKIGITPTRVNLGQEIPPQKLYQFKKTLDALPIGKRSTTTWDNWIQGIKQLEIYSARVQSGLAYTFDDLKRVHKGFFELADEVGDFSHVPDEGIIKPAVSNDNYWWPMGSDSETQTARASIAVSNQEFERAGLVDPKLDPEFKDVLRIKYVPKAGASPGEGSVVPMVWVIYSGDSRANRTHVEYALTFFNEVIASLRSGQPIRRNDWLLTPMQAAYLLQKFYVGVHPFSEGNGRTSRLLQELLLTSMRAPHGSSGDLMDEDVMSSFSSYYEKAIAGQRRVLSTIQNCENEYRNAFWGMGLKDEATATAVQKMASRNDRLTYSCKILQ